MTINWLKRAEDCLDDLIDTDRQLAELKVKAKKDEKKAENIYDAIFDRTKTDSDGKPLTVEARKVKARRHVEYQSAIEAGWTSLLEYEALRNRRETNKAVTDFWKSWQRAVREGEI